MLNEQEKYAIVFGGGGIRGAYEVGVWRAIQELKIPVGMVIGSSIGALNAVFAVQGADLARLYQEISLQDVIPDDNLDSSKDIFEISNLITTAKGVVTNKGYSTSNLRNLIEKYIDYDVIYNSPINIGLVTCTTPFSPIVAFKDKIPKEDLTNYIIASCGFPIFKRQSIGEKKCIDGGFWDNVPVNVAISKGYSNIISVDLSSIGFRKKTKNFEGLHLITIKAPSGSLGGLFEVNREQIVKNIEKGYIDAINLLTSK